MRFDYVIPALYNDHDIRFNDALATELERRGANVALVAHTRYGESELKKRHPNVFYLYEGFDASVPASVADLNALEKKYDLGSVADLVYPEMVVPGAQSQEMLFRRALHDFRFIERMCETHDVRMFVNSLGPELIRRCMFKVRDRGGPAAVVFDFAPLHGRIVLTTKDTGWDDFPAELPTLDAAQRDAMIAFVKKATADRKAFYDAGWLTVEPRTVVNAARYAWRAVSERVDFDLGELVVGRAQSLVRVRAAKMLYEQPVPGERFYFFPLHIAEDSAVTIRAPQFQRQQELIRYIAERVLPVGVKLYVKPHIAAMHAYSHAMLSEIASIPNVKLVDARIIAHELVRKAEAVVVINSTVGFEALLYGKPVVVLGRVFYRGRGVTTDVDQLADLRTAVAGAVRNPPDMEKVYRFLQVCHDLTVPGALASLEPENFVHLADGLEKKGAALGIPFVRAAQTRSAEAARAT